MHAKLKFIVPLIALASLSLQGCATISAEQCHAGNWEDRGYKDGVSGKSRGRLLDYVDTCSEHGASVDRMTYLQSYEAGLTYYCVPEKGYQLGRSGSRYNTVCTGSEAEGFKAGYSQGYSEYQIEYEYRRLVSAIESREDAIASVRERLRHAELSKEESNRLKSKLNRLERELRALRSDLYAFQRANHLENRRY